MKNKVKLPEVYNIGKQEINAVVALMKKGPLSDFLGARGDKYLGGKNVKKLESAFCKKFKVKHAVSFNSATTALHASIVALGIGPGDEVIVAPYSMSASATAILMNGAVPIFADLDENNFCLDPKSVRARITPRTKAIMVVNLFGGSPNYDELLKVAREFKLKVIEDNAQGAGGKYKGKFLGTIGDIGIFSYNVHKTIQSGEGGVLVTNNDEYALRAQMSRNHGEMYADQTPGYSSGPIIGSNYRMTEVEAVIAYEQLKKLDFLNKKRIELADHLAKGIGRIPGVSVIKPPAGGPKGSMQVYYGFPIKFDEKVTGISREEFAKGMAEEGFPMSCGYVKPIYLLRVFQEKKVFNNTSFPFEYEHYDGKPDYSKGICPVVERMHEKELLVTAICQYPRTKKHIDLFVAAFKKVLNGKGKKNSN